MSTATNRNAHVNAAKLNVGDRVRLGGSGSGAWSKFVAVTAIEPVKRGVFMVTRADGTSRTVTNSSWFTVEPAEFVAQPAKAAPRKTAAKTPGRKLAEAAPGNLAALKPTARKTAKPAAKAAPAKLAPKVSTITRRATGKGSEKFATVKEPLARLAKSSPAKRAGTAKLPMVTTMGELTREQKQALAAVLIVEAGSIIVGWDGYCQVSGLENVDAKAASEQFAAWLQYLPGKSWSDQLSMPPIRSRRK